MKKITLFMILMIGSLGFSQSLPFTFSNPDELFLGNDCTTSLTTDPNDAANAVMQVVGGGFDYDNALKTLTPVNLSDDANNSIYFRIKPVSGTGSGKHLFKFEGGTDAGVPGQTEVAFTTTGTDWQEIEVNFGAGLGSYPKMVIFTDFVSTSIDTYLIDDIRLGQSTGATPGLPFTFSKPTELFTGDGCATSLTTDPNNAANAVMQVVGGGADYDNAQKDLTPVNLSDDASNTIFFRIKPVNGTGSGSHLLKFENGTGGPAQVEMPFTTTGTDWQNIAVNYGAGLGSFTKMVIFTDFVSTSIDTYLIDDISVGAALATKSFSATNLKMYPNPATNNLTIDGINSIENVAVYNTIGQQVINLNPKSNSVTLNVSGLQNGLYIVKSTVEGKVASSKFVKK